MKRKFTWITALSVLLALFVGLGIFAACDKGGGSEAKPSEYVDGVNCYYGDGNDVHIQGWYGSLSDSLFTVEEADDGSTHMHYYGDAAWRDFRFSIDGEYSDFSWLNITMKRGETAVVAFVKIVNPIREEYDNPNVLGADVYFDLSTIFCPDGHENGRGTGGPIPRPAAFWMRSDRSCPARPGAARPRPHGAQAPAFSSLRLRPSSHSLSAVGFQLAA